MRYNNNNVTFVYIIRWIDSYQMYSNVWRVTKLVEALNSISDMDGLVLDIRVVPKAKKCNSITSNSILGVVIYERS